MRHVLGVDPSATKTGFAVLNEEGGLFMAGTIRALDKTGFDRVVALRSQLLILTRNIPELALAAIEGYAFSNAHSLATLAEVGTAYRLHFVDEGIPFIVPQPSQVKKFVQIKGKEKPKAKVQELWGWAPPNHDVADAYVIARIALATLKPRMATRPHELDVITAVRSGFKQVA